MNVQSKSTVTAERGDILTAGVIGDWLDPATSPIPRDAQITTITKDIGNQRDPVVVLVGLTASWSEER